MRSENGRAALQDVPTTRFVALLGGTNVGGRGVTMDRLRSEVASLGDADFATFIASGNAIFTRGSVSRPTRPVPPTPRDRK